MLKFIKNEKGIMGLTLSQIGLIIAAAIIIAAFFSIIFQNDWEKNAELRNVATSFTTIVEAMDARFFENTTTFNFPDKKFEYTVTLSTEYITTTAKGRIDDELFVKERFLVKPWPLENNSVWVGRDELHSFLKTNYSNSGNLSDPIKHVDDVKYYLNSGWESTATSLALNPLLIFTDRVVYVDKTIIHYENGEKQGFVFIYQN